MKELPKTLKAFAQHGVRITEWDEDEATCTCPFCGKARHFFVSVKKQTWKCFAGKCGRSGNLSQFLQRRMDAYREALDGQPLKNIAQHRSLNRATFTRWGVGYDRLTERYMGPLLERGKVTDIHRYDLSTKLALATSSCGGGMFLLPGDTELHDTITICEGQWDTYAFDEALRDAGRQEAIIGVAGAKRIPKTISELVTHKHVLLAFDHDLAGWEGDQRCRQLMMQHPKSVHSVHWPENRPVGFDIRDLWIESGRDGRTFFTLLKPLIKKEPMPKPKTVDTPDDATALATTTAVGTFADPPNPDGKGMKRADVLAGYRKWLYLPDSDILDVAFGTAFANRLPGRPLWMFLVGPPGGLKTEIIQSFGDSVTTSLETDITRQALVSGMQTLSGADPSLIPAWNGRLVLIADFTTILSMNQLERDAIFGILRSAYDGRYEKKFGNGVLRIYRSCFGILAGVTPVIETFSVTHPVLGERFVKFYVSRSSSRIRHETAAVEASLDNLNRETTMQEELRAVAKQALERKVDLTKPPDIHPEVKHRLVLLAQWAAAMRGVVSRDRYTQDVLHRPVTEIGTRLVKQFAKLTQGVAMFRGKHIAGFDEFRIAAQVARDSAPDRVELIIHHLYLQEGKNWFGPGEIAELVKLPRPTVQKILQDMTMLHLVRARKTTGDLSAEYSLSDTMRQTMQPLDLYVKEAQWSRAFRRKSEKPSKNRRTRKES